MAAQAHRITANGLRHYVRDSGEKNAPVAILLHGFPDSSAIWDKAAPFLREAGFRVMAPDMRGFGETDMALRVADYEIRNGAVKDVIGVMDALDIKIAHIAGHDFGAPVAWALAAQHPDRFRTLTAISVGHSRAYLKAGWEQKRRGAYILFHLLTGICERAYRARDWALLRRHWAAHGDIEETIRLLARPGRLTAGLNWYRANVPLARLLRAPPPGSLGEETVRIPTLGLWSDGEIYLTEAQMTGSSDYVDAPWAYKQIKGASHWIPYDAPEALAHAMISHWRENAA